MTRIQNPSWHILPLALSLLPTTAIAESSEEVIPEIVVTADFRETAESRTASSITVVSENTIRSRAAEHLDDVLNMLPNINYSAGSNRARFFQIRGIGERSQFAAPLNPSVGLLIDDVDFSGAGTVATMLDVEQVEILRGPQGTRYGANSLAGLINIKTRDPLDTFGARFSAGVAGYGTSRTTAMITGPLSDGARFRIAAGTYRSDGYYRNDFLARDDTNGRDELTLRGKLALEPSDRWQMVLTLASIDMDDGYDAFSLDNNRRTRSDDPGKDSQKSRSVGIKSTWNLHWFDVVGIANYAVSDIEYSYDEDWTFTGFHPFGYTSKDNYFRDRKSGSVELRLISNENGKLGNTDWLAGFYSLFSDEDLLRKYTFLSDDFFSRYDFTTLAFFFQLDSALTENFVLSTGVRLERRSTDYSNSDNVAFHPKDNLWGGRLALQYFSTGNTMIYGSIARGYKAGGFNTDGSLDPDLREFDEEYLVEYELGVKTVFLNGRGHLRAALFRDDRHDQQVKSSIVRVREDGSTEFIDFQGNAASGTNKGLEVEADWYATDSLRFLASLGLLQARFDRYINEFGEDLSGRDQAQAPAWMFHTGIEYTSGHWMFTVTADGKDRFFFSDRHSVKSRSYVLLNTSLSYTTGHWSFRLWGRNLTDRDYYTRAFGSFGNDPRKNYATEPYYQFGEPRILGVTIDWTY